MVGDNLICTRFTGGAKTGASTPKKEKELTKMTQ